MFLVLVLACILGFRTHAAFTVAGGGPGSSGGLPRGVDPAHASRHAGTTFTCADGSRVMPSERVNDDYCDCADGSDEPGTSACALGRFFCANKGHEPRTLAACFVDDGICDCCDGSDEPPRACAHTCLDHSAPAVEALQSYVSTYSAGLARRPEYVQRAGAQRERWAARRHTIKRELEVKAAQLNAAMSLRAHAEKENVKWLEARGLERKRQQQEEEEQRRKLQEEQKAEEQAKEGAQGEQQQGQGAEQQQEQQAEHAGETVEERGRRIASRWTQDPAAAGAGKTPLQAQEEKQQLLLSKLREEKERRASKGKFQRKDTQTADASGAPSPALSRQHRIRAGEKLSEWEQFLFFGDILGQYLHNWAAWLKMVFKEGIKKDLLHRRERAAAAAEAKYARETGRFGRRGNGQAKEAAAEGGELQEEDMSDALKEAVKRVTDLASELRALQKEQNDTIRFSTGQHDWGPDDVFLPFAGRCFTDSTSAHPWVYEVCFYDGAWQSGGPQNQERVSLGAWKGFALQDPNAQDFRFMAVIDGGDVCGGPGSPARNMQLLMQCGEGDVLFETREVATCMYESRFVTPAACSEAEYAHLQAGLAATHEQRAAIRAEVEARAKEEL